MPLLNIEQKSMFRIMPYNIEYDIYYQNIRHVFFLQTFGKGSLFHKYDYIYSVKNQRKKLIIDKCCQNIAALLL